MSATGTAIEWADVAHNVVHGCSPKSAGCWACYAARMDGTRLKHNEFTDSAGEIHTMESLVKLVPGKPKIGKSGQELKAREPGRYVYNGQVYLDPAALQSALKLPRAHHGKRGYSVFWNFRSDTFHEALTNEEIAAQFGVMAARPDLTFLVLTKRAKRMREWFEWMTERPDPVERLNDALAAHANTGLDPYVDYPWPLPNIRLGVSAEHQETADERIPELMATPAAGNFVSLEPMLGHIDVRRWLLALNWLIVGAESGPNARPAELSWVRSVRDQVLAARDERADPMEGDPHLFIKQIDVCGRCTGSTGEAFEDVDGIDEFWRCLACGGTGLAGKVRKGNPAIDGRNWAEVPQ